MKCVGAAKSRLGGASHIPPALLKILVCTYGQVALMLSGCDGTAKQLTFKSFQHHNTGDKVVDSFMPLFMDFTDCTMPASRDVVAAMHNLNCQVE